MSEFNSDLITLNAVINQHYLFNIPIYQRLYVWGKEQIHTLLDDIVNAFQEQKSTFYLGGTLVIERTAKTSNQQIYPVFDLIDGQQRFTTLWLISVVLQGALKEYQQLQTDDGILPRISFAIRPKVSAFFDKICQGKQASLPEALQLEDALQDIQSYFDNYSNLNDKTLDKTALIEFILNKVQLVLTKVPANTDLNKLFEVINNRGVQLQHHEILKARLLEKIEQNEREAYAQIWDACANMNEYVERNLRSTTRLNTVELYEKLIETGSSNRQREALSDPQSVIEALQALERKSQCQPTSLLAALESSTVFTTEFNHNKQNEEQDLPDRVGSIITFSMLLQHVLRIFLVKNTTVANTDISKISDKDLLSIFQIYWLNNVPDANQVKGFIQLLWQVRYLFDKNVIKWVMVEDERVHAIRRLYINKSSTRNTAYLQRLSNDAEPDFALLQSMLYHSQQMTTQYWLTPLLNFLIDNDTSDAYLYLRHLDNHLLCSASDDSLIKRTHRYLVNPWHKETLIPASKSLNQTFKNGTQYPHYWFYKLEFILYLKLKTENKRGIDDFRITSKNSVEHITPQNPEKASDRITDELLHNFGNLALVTRSLNSEMSNKGFSIKQAEFRERYLGRGMSLKLEDVYANSEWQKIQIEQHQNKMITAFQKYLDAVEESSIKYCLENRIHFEIVPPIDMTSQQL